MSCTIVPHTTASLGGVLQHYQGSYSHEAATLRVYSIGLHVPLNTAILRAIPQVYALMILDWKAAVAGFSLVASSM